MRHVETDQPANALDGALRACRPQLVQVALFSVLLNLLGLAPTLFMLQVYDRALPARSVPTLVMLSAIFLAAMLVNAVLDFIRARLLMRAGVRLDRLLSRPVLDALFRKQGPATASGLRNLDTLRQAATGPTLLALFDAPWTPLFLIVALLVHPAIGALALAGGAALVAIAWMSERRTAGLVGRAAEARSRAYSGIDRTLAHAPLLGVFGLRDTFLVRHGAERDQSVSVNLDATFAASSYVTAAKSLRAILQSAGLGVGALLAIDGRISGGAVFAASLLIGKTLAPIEQITAAWRNFGHARVAFTGLRRLFDDREPEPVRTRLPEPRGALEVSRLTLDRPGGDAPILAGVGFTVSPGELVGLIGPSGAGKSTLARAIAGIVRADGGEIRLDGAELGDWPADQRVAALGYVPQEPILFEGTVGENIAGFPERRGPDVDAAIVRAAQLCGAHDFVLRLPQAYETMIAPGSHILSAGQAQTIAIARALYRRPKLLVLDEPNANLDAAGEAGLARAIATVRAEGTSVLLVAHRQAILADADKLLLLVGGRVAAFGPAADVRAHLAARGAPPVTAPPRAVAAAAAAA